MESVGSFRPGVLCRQRVFSAQGGKDAFWMVEEHVVVCPRGKHSFLQKMFTAWAFTRQESEALCHRGFGCGRAAFTGSKRKTGEEHPGARGSALALSLCWAVSDEVFLASARMAFHG